MVCAQAAHIAQFALSASNNVGVGGAVAASTESHAALTAGDSTAATAAKELGVDEVSIRDGINNFQAAFGRAEDLVIDGKRVRILLSKNPVGTNETIRVVTESTDKTTLLVLNDRTPDGTDVSWIWDVDTEKLVARGGTLIVSGDRVYDMALRLRYSQESGQ